LSLVDEAALKEVRVHEAQEHQQRLRQKRSLEEAWFAHNEVVKFVQSRRYDVTKPVNFAKAMAGLPEYSWIHSFRKCPVIEDDPIYPATFNYQLFQLLERCVKRANPRSVENIAKVLRDELLKLHPKDLLRVHFSPSWWYIVRGVDSCRGHRGTRSELPYILMEKIQDHLEQGKDVTEMELAKRYQLV
jgi:hypothetical protein